MKRSVVVTWAFMLYALIVPFTVGAVDAPHYDPAAGLTCATCHTGHLTLGSTGYNNICHSCHRPGNPLAGINPFTPADQANPFGNHSTIGLTRLFQTSHRWAGPDSVPAAGAQPPVQAAMTSNALRARSGNQLACVRCHNPHFNTSGKFLRLPNDQDQLCLDCHRSRNVSSHLQGSHPVNIDYNSAAGSFNRPPVNSNPANPTSDLNARLSASGGKLLCTTCHGVHYTDSHSGTIDGRDNFTNLSSSDGNLLRTDRRGAAVFSGIPDRQNICTNCHAGKKSHNQKSQDVQCIDCHGAHVEYDPKDPSNSRGTNIDLIRRNVSKAGQPTQIFFRYTGSRREYKNAQGTGVCQGCHDVPAPGTLGAPPEHASNDAKVCNTCHFHNGVNGSFSGSCANCHGYPPISPTIGGPTGLANPGTNALGAAPTSPGAHATHATGRMMSCNTCHNGYKDKQMPSSTIDIGFAINSGNVPGFSGNVTSGTLNGSNALIGYNWSAGPGSTVTPVNNFNTTCSVYCHGSTLTGGSNSTPSWTGTNQAACGSCHGATPATAPTSGGHARHAGSGAGRLAIPCASCHGNHPDKSHVNGNVEWDLSSLGPNAQYKTPTGVSARIGGTKAIAPSSAYGQCANIYCHSTVQGAGGSGAAIATSQPTWGAAALACGSCHADMSGPSASGSHIIHARDNAIACASCHNGLGHDTASHANSSIDLAFSGSASGTVYSKGTSFVPGSGYGSCTTSCHLNKPITWGTTLPVNCTGCHGGNAASSAMIASGMHIKHINQVLPLSSGIACAECHNATVSLASDRVITTPANHANSRVNVSFARGGSYANGTCSATYCHGATLQSSNPARTAPSWNTPFPAGTSVPGNGIAGGSNPGSGYCAQCHGYPPQNGHATSGCSSCHAHLNTDNLTFNNPSLHINGVVDALSSSCDSCHGYPPAKPGFAGAPGNWAGSKAENYPGGGGAHTIPNHVSKSALPSEGFSNCSKCHNQADHQISPLAFTPSQNIRVRLDQSFRLESTKQSIYVSNQLDGSAHQTGTCSNISCHFGATPKWDPAQ
jgi:predicted CxxxxCH...CXXCH cytochrome family protein